MTKILFFAGSNGSHSLNARLALAASKQAEALGAEVTVLDLEDYELPLYCSDLEAKQGIPDNAAKLKEIFMEHDGVFVASPEYNSAYSPLLKNTIDWISRVRADGEPMLPAFTGKVYGIGAISPGGMGGYRGLVALRMLLGNIGIHVVPTQVAVGGGSDAFADDGSLNEGREASMLQATVKELVETAKALA